MAWRSSGSTNDEMVDKLKRNHIIHSDAVEAGFRKVDRSHFVPQNVRHLAYTDQPLKEGHLHISAPHIYGAVLEALELRSPASTDGGGGGGGGAGGGGNNNAVLHLGSGTGYMSAILCQILGPTSFHVAIELQQDVIQHCRHSWERWHTDLAARNNENNNNNNNNGVWLPEITLLRGNALEIDSAQGHGALGFDRIYVGAALNRLQLPKIAALLKPGGIMVAPVDDELLKVVRIGNEAGVQAPPAPPTRSNGRRTTPTLSAALSNDFTQQVLSGVRFAALLVRPHLQQPLTIRSPVWNPTNHACYPTSFRQATTTVLLCARASAQPPPLALPPRPPPPGGGVNLASTLPRALWMEILSFAHRDWFEHDNQHHGRWSTDLLRRRLEDEMTVAARAREALQEAEARIHVLTRERNLYRYMAHEYHQQLQEVTHGEVNMDMVDFEEAMDNMEPHGLDLNEPWELLGTLRRAVVERVPPNRNAREAPEESDTDEDTDEDMDEEDSLPSRLQGDELNEVIPSVEPFLPARRQQPRTVSIVDDP